MKKNQRNGLYVRNIVFGVEDSLVSTVGLLSGIASAGVSHKVILLTGFVYILIEGFSMAIGSYLSEESALEYEKGPRATTMEPILAAGVMLLSFTLAGFVPIIPYLLLSGTAALAWSVGISLAVLGFVGYVQARYSGVKTFLRVLRIVTLGGIAIAIGLTVGSLLGIE